ncbi:MAG: class GN sortase [Gammaproteobacteria bacterium]|nr:MAG: class GN sortase [Gammaproteobacteria bacterium]
MRRRLRLCILGMLLLIGLWQLSQGIYIHAKARMAQLLLEQAWTTMLQDKMKATPWPWADTWPVARLQVPRLNEDLIVLAGDSGRTLAFGPGHNFVSALPGEKGTAMISAHRDTHFAFLQHLHVDDNIIIVTPQGLHKTYRVESLRILQADNASLIYEPDVSRLALLTCYPFDAIQAGGSLRYVVTAVEMDRPQLLSF